MRAECGNYAERNSPPTLVNTVITLWAVDARNYCGVNDDKWIECKHDVVTRRAQFYTELVDVNRIAIKSIHTGQYCTDYGDEGIKCSATLVDNWEKFSYEYIQKHGLLDASISLKGGKDGKYCYAGERPVCNRGSRQSGEIFKYTGDESKRNGFSYPWHVNYSADAEYEPPNLRNTVITLIGGHDGKYCGVNDDMWIQCNRDWATEITLKGGNAGKYCGVNDKKWIQCNSEKVTDAELFHKKFVGDNKIAIKSVRTGRYCTDFGDEGIKCDTTVVAYWERFLDERRGANTISLRGGKNNKFCADDQSRLRVICNRDQAQRDEIFTYEEKNFLTETEKFQTEYLGENGIAIKSVRTGQYCTDYGNEGVNCNGTVVDFWERFFYERRGGRTLSLRGGKDNKFCADDQGRGRVICNRDQAQRDEIFTYEENPFLPPIDAYTRLMFRLPVMDITKRVCTISPFTSRNRTHRTQWGVPTACSDDATRAIVNIIGAGPFEIPTNSTAELAMSPTDNDTITCNVTWRNTPPGLVQITTSITVDEGPVYNTDNFFVSADNTTWRSAIYDFNQSVPAFVSLRTALQNTTRSTLVIGCRVVGIDPATSLPVVALSTTNKIVFELGSY